MIVVIIIALLIVAFGPKFLGTPAKARDTQRMAEIKKIVDYLSPGSLKGDLGDTACVDELGLDVAAFGGKIPSDPQPMNIVGNCTGQYQFVHYTTSGSPYTFAVFAKMEKPENGNVNCDETFVKDGAAPLADLKGINLSSPNGCYGMFVQ